MIISQLMNENKLDKMRVTQLQNPVVKRQDLEMNVQWVPSSTGTITLAMISALQLSRTLT